MSNSGRDDERAGQLQPGQQTDTGTGHGVKGQGGQETSEGVPDGGGDQAGTRGDATSPPAED